MGADTRPRVLLLFPSQSYRVDAFAASASGLGVSLILVTASPAAFARYDFPLLAVDFREPARAADDLVSRLAGLAPAGVVATNETSAVVASLVAARLGLPHVRPEAALAA